MSASTQLLDTIWHRPGGKARLVALSLLGMLLVFWPTLGSMHGVWTRYTYSHGYLVAPVVVWLAWRRRDAILAPGPGASAALLPLAALSLLWFVAVVTHVQVIHQGLLPVILLLWAAAVGGWDAARRLLPAAVVFLFAVPFWEVLTRPLQLLTIAVNGAGVRLLGIPAEITGEYITIPSGTFRVAHTCAGLNFFIIGLLLGTLYAHLFTGRWKTRLQIMGAAVALALVANWIRVIGLVIIGHVTEMQWPYLEDHGFYGWVVFVVVFSLFFPVAGFLLKRASEGAGRSAPPTPLPEEEPAVDESDARETETPASPRPGAGRLPTARVALATALAALGPIAYLAFRAAPAAALEEPVEPEKESWTLARDVPAEPPATWQPGFPEPDRRLESVWTDGTADIYRLELVYHGQRQGRELVGGENSIASSGDVAAEDFLWLPEEDVWVREAFVRTDEGIVVVWYWYRIGGIDAVSPAKAKALELWAFLRRRPSAALVTLAAACESDRCRDERTALRAFLAGVPAATLAARQDGEDEGR